MTPDARDGTTRCEASTDRPLVAAQHRQDRIVGVTIRVGDRREQSADTARAPVAIAFAVDRSGSMAARAGTNRTVRGLRGPTAHDLACHALEGALRRLSPHDRVSIALFDHEVTLLVDNEAPVADRVPGWMEKARDTGPRGSTNLGHGWLHAARAAATSAQAGYHARVFLLTDGQANVGMTAPSEFVEHARALRERGVSSSTFGLGATFSEELLAQLADAGGGAYWYAPTPEQLEPAFLAELGDALDIVHTRVTLVLRCEDPAVVLERDPAYEGEWNASQQAWITRLPDLVAGQELELVFPVAVLPGSSGSRVALEITVCEDGKPVATTAVGWSRVAEPPEQARDAPLTRSWAARYADAVRLRAAALHRGGSATEARRVLASAAQEIAQWLPGDPVLHALLQDLLEEAEWLSRSVDPERLKVWHTATVSSLSGVSTTGRARTGGLDVLQRSSIALRRSTREAVTGGGATAAAGDASPHALSALFPRPPIRPATPTPTPASPTGAIASATEARTAPVPPASDNMPPNSPRKP